MSGIDNMIPAELLGGSGDGQLVWIEPGKREYEHNGATYRVDPDPLTANAPTLLADGMTASVVGGVATRTARALAKAATGSRLRQHLALMPLLADAVAAGARFVHTEGRVELLRRPRPAFDPADHTGLVARVAAQMNMVTDRNETVFGVVRDHLASVALAVDDGALDITFEPPAVVDVERARLWPLAPALWRRTCDTCGYPITDLYEDAAPSAHLKCSADG